MEGVVEVIRLGPISSRRGGLQTIDVESRCMIWTGFLRAMFRGWRT